MTLTYLGKSNLSSVSVNSRTLVIPAGSKPAKNNKARIIDQFEFIQVDEVKNTVTKSNIKNYHFFFTQTY